MAKKRKASGRHAETSSGPSLDVGQSKKRIRDFEDVAGSDDEFHLNRDRVLLDEGPDAKRRRKLQEQEEFLQPSDEEVLGYSDSEDEGAIEEDPRKYEPDVVGSDSEGSHEAVDDEEDDLGWGTAKDDIYGADEIETEEQALEEEAEALRLQQKQLQSMTAADYGFDEAEWQDGDVDKDDSQQDYGNVVTEVLPQLQISNDLGPAERLKLLKSRYPEFEPLAKELVQLREYHTDLIAQMQGEDYISGMAPNTTTKFRAASAYLGALTMYFTLLTSPAVSSSTDSVAMPATQLRDHPLMSALVKCRELWLRAKELPPDPKIIKDIPQIRSGGVGAVDDANNITLDVQKAKQRSAKKSRAQRHADAAQAAMEVRKAERMQRTEADLANLEALVAQTTKKTSVKSARPSIMANQDDSDIGDEAPLTAHEAAEKAKHKKSLRFYTSQIAQKANKRGAAGRNAGGDDDIPHRERLRDRQARLNAEAEKRGRKTVDARADLGGESDEEDARQIDEIRGDAEDDYYDFIATKTAKKKADKAAFAEAQKQAALHGGRVIPEETVGVDGKRKITYAIEKNKGLTPHRKKEVRNPRVKKRKKFDEKKKKLASMKPVYKGGEGRGGYGGELTGIKKSLVKSTKL